jgi:tetratricopeptide (TPR) repeat protein
MLNGRFTEALNLLQAEKSQVPINQETQFNFDLLINTLYIRQGEYKKAREEIDKALEKYGRSLNAIDLLLCKIEALYRLGKSTDALTVLETTEKMLYGIDAKNSEIVVRIAALLYR